MSDTRVLLAHCGAAHGIRGEVRVKTHTGAPLALGDYGPLTVEDGPRTLEVERLREADTVAIVKFHGIDDRTAAEALTGLGLYVERDALPEPEDDDTFYHADLIGLPVEDAAGERLGEIVAVVNFGASDLLEIQPPEGTTVYLAFTADFVTLVDVDAGRVVIAPPEDLFHATTHAEAPPKKRTRSPRARDRQAARAADGEA